MEEQIYLVNVKPMPHKSFLIRAKNEREAEEAAKHMLDTTVYSDKSTFLVQAYDIPQQGKFSNPIYSAAEVIDKAEKQVYFVDYSQTLDFTVAVWARDEEEAEAAANKLIDSGRVVPSEKLSKYLNESRYYDETMVSYEYDSLEEAEDDAVEIYDADEVLEENHE